MKIIADSDWSEILQDIRELIDRQNRGALINIFLEMHPADTASLLTQLKKDERKYLFRLLPTDFAGSVLTELDPPVVEQLLEDSTDKHISLLIDGMDSDDAADIVSELPEEKQSRVLDYVSDEVEKEVKELLTYEEDTAGGIMALEFVAVSKESTVNETIEVIRELRDELETVHEIWVIDEAEVLVGKVTLTELVLANGRKKISNIMETEFQWVGTNVDQEEVAIIFRKYDLVVLPVVNEAMQLVGQITIDDIIDVLDDEVSEDLSMLAGANDEELQEESFIKISWVRLPWLMVAFVGELLSAFVIKNFDGTLQHIIALSFFIPIIMAMGGNSGIQSSVIVIRGLATGEISINSLRRRFMRELRVSLFIGLIFGIIMTFSVGIWLGNFKLGMVIGAALNLIILQAALFGGLIPFILKRGNIDPALASGPFITTFNDVLGLLIYLAIVSFSLPYLL